MDRAVLCICVLKVARHAWLEYSEYIYHAQLLAVGRVTVKVDGRLAFVVTSDLARGAWRSADPLGAAAWCHSHKLPAECPDLLRARVKELVSAEAHSASAVLQQMLLKPSGELLPLLWIVGLCALLHAAEYLGAGLHHSSSSAAVRIRDQQPCRANGVDLVRLLLALVVLLSHAFCETGNQGIEPLWLVSGSTIYLGQVAMHLFFLLGGYYSAASLQRRLDHHEQQQRGGWRVALDFLESRVRALVPPLCLFALATAGFLGPNFTSLSRQDYATDARVWRFFAEFVAPFTPNTERFNLGGSLVPDVPNLPGLELPPRTAVVVPEHGVANALHSLQLMWLCYLSLALLVCCCPQPRAMLHRATFVTCAWSLSIFASGSGLIQPGMVFFTVGAAFYGNLPSAPSLHWWALAAASPVLWLVTTFLESQNTNAALALGAPTLLYATLALANSPFIKCVGGLSHTRGLSTHVWIWHSCILRLVLRAVPSRVLGGGELAPDSSLVPTFVWCVLIPKDFSLDGDVSGATKVRICGHNGACRWESITDDQVAEMRRAECSAEIALVAFAIATPLTLVVGLAAARVCRAVGPNIFLAVAVCTCVADVLILL